MPDPDEVLYQTSEGPLTQREYEILSEQIHDQNDFLTMEQASKLCPNGRLETPSLTKKQTIQISELIIFGSIGIHIG